MTNFHNKFIKANYEDNNIDSRKIQISRYICLVLSTQWDLRA